MNMRGKTTSEWEQLKRDLYIYKIYERTSPMRRPGLCERFGITPKELHEAVMRASDWEMFAHDYRKLCRNIRKRSHGHRKRWHLCTPYHPQPWR